MKVACPAASLAISAILRVGGARCCDRSLPSQSCCSEALHAGCLGIIPCGPPRNFCGRRQTRSGSFLLDFLAGFLGSLRPCTTPCGDIWVRAASSQSSCRHSVEDKGGAGGQQTLIDKEAWETRTCAMREDCRKQGTARSEFGLDLRIDHARKRGRRGSRSKIMQAIGEFLVGYRFQERLLIASAATSD